ncbi:hypothetical protein K1719_001796 [Acacia pycnantha]|nr:hypothetical protein K1719_001796 [Acacia pycnantha]
MRMFLMISSGRNGMSPATTIRFIKLDCEERRSDLESKALQIQSTSEPVGSNLFAYGFWFANPPSNERLDGTSGLILPLKRLNGQEKRMKSFFILLSLCPHNGEHFLQL